VEVFSCDPRQLAALYLIDERRGRKHLACQQLKIRNPESETSKPEGLAVFRSDFGFRISDFRAAACTFLVQTLSGVGQ
jgi:hypothetical protein